MDNTFRCRFYEIPVAEYIADDLPADILDLNDESIDVHSGTMEVNFKRDVGQGRFKTAHPGSVKLDGGADLPPFTSGTVCVKQIYRQRTNGGGIARLPGRYELGAFFGEANRVRWASILLDMAYQFVMDEITRRGEPNYRIPELRYTRSMVAIVQGTANEKAYLIEEWIHTDEGDSGTQFYKYIDNRTPTSALPLSAPQEACDIASFLLFTQHVQWEKTCRKAFVSDYQGAGRLLTDPQITTNPCVLPLLCLFQRSY